MEQKRRYDFFDVIKGIMILFVIITHYQWAYLDDYLKYGFVFYLDMAVPVFMIVTGYLTSLSFKKKNITCAKEAVSPQNVLPKILRFVIPFLMAFIVEIPFIVLQRGDLLASFVRGGIGPGAYYVPILIQLVFVVPIVYIVVRNHGFAGVVGSFIFTAAWEIIQYSWELTDMPYKYLSFRYVSLIAFGCFFALSKGKIKKTPLLLIFVLGLGWQVALNYVPLSPAFMNLSWARVNYLSTLFVIPIMYFLIEKCKTREFKLPILKTLGKASYDIFLVQMVFYAYGSSVVYKLIGNKALQLLVCIIVCCIAGYLFYLVENRITNWVLGIVQKKNCFGKELANIEDRLNQSFIEELK